MWLKGREFPARKPQNGGAPRARRDERRGV
jgi:hypothetical protein